MNICGAAFDYNTGLGPYSIHFTNQATAVWSKFDQGPHLACGPDFGHSLKMDNFYVVIGVVPKYLNKQKSANSTVEIGQIRRTGIWQRNKTNFLYSIRVLRQKTFAWGPCSLQLLEKKKIIVFQIPKWYSNLNNCKGKVRVCGIFENGFIIQRVCFRLSSQERKCLARNIMLPLFCWRGFWQP